MLIYCNLDFVHHDLVCTFDEFACWDGTCVHIDDVCNGKMDCNDKSDEINCQSIKFPNHNSYMKNLPPPPFKPMGYTEKSPIYLEMIVYSVLELDEMHSMMKLQLELQAKWIDTRLEFTNLKSEHYSNRLTGEEKQKIWLPPLRFANNKEKKKAMLEDDSIGYILLSQNASFHFHPLFKTKIFSGKDG